jgi:hypothetical protein
MHTCDHVAANGIFGCPLLAVSSRARLRHAGGSRATPSYGRAVPGMCSCFVQAERDRIAAFSRAAFAVNRQRHLWRPGPSQPEVRCCVAEWSHMGQRDNVSIGSAPLEIARMLPGLSCSKNAPSTLNVSSKAGAHSYCTGSRTWSLGRSATWAYGAKS